MVGKTNAGGGGGGKLFAIIAVTYPAGSVCTCSNGTKTLKARDTSGKALFNVSTGTWTVTATDGNETKDATVDITTEGQLESVTLSYRYYFVKDGVILKTFTKINVGSMSTDGDTALIVTDGNITSVAYIKENISNYQNLILDVTSSGEKISRSWRGEQVPVLGLTQNTPVVSGNDVTPTFEGGFVYLNDTAGNIAEGNYKVPVDSLNDYFNVCVSVAGSSLFSGTVGQLYIRNLYLE